MSILINSRTKNLEPWIDALKFALPEEEIITVEELKDPEDVVTAVVWNHEKDLFERIPHVKHIASLGAGVDHILKDPLVPKEAIITRVISDHLSGPMSNYCIGAILHYQRQFDKYILDKEAKIWDQQPDPERELTIGIMGLGVLGGDLARKLIALGIHVNGWSTTRKEIPGVISYVSEELDEFLAESNLIVCMLPATQQTKNILNKDLFNKLSDNSYLINVARGFHQVNEDIVQALDTGKLAGAFLDVFPEEPLPENDPLWEHSKVMITPHIAVVTKIEAAIPAIAENHRAIIVGEDPLSVVDREKGY